MRMAVLAVAAAGCAASEFGAGPVLALEEGGGIDHAAMVAGRPLGGNPAWGQAFMRVVTASAAAASAGCASLQHPASSAGRRGHGSGGGRQRRWRRGCPADSQSGPAHSTRRSLPAQPRRPRAARRRNRPRPAAATGRNGSDPACASAPGRHGRSPGAAECSTGW
ncbi:hypothetical protein G6F35_014752 [Rhizopus arrhizus]|nr:hypothetical protein G6F35_014752 [Rhizopus arrhizus]